MKKDFGVSIVIPAYNSATTITETLKSVFAQTFSNWEVIVVNDGSNDETATIAERLAAQDSRIRAVNQLNSGASVARNTGIELAQFEWLLFLDADDWILPTHLEKLISILFSDPKIDVAHCGWVRVTPEQEPCESAVRNPSGDLFDLLAEDNLFAIHSCIVRRSLVREVGNFDPTLKTLEDWDLWLRIARTGAYFSGTDEVLAYYRDRPGSLTTNELQILIDSMGVLERVHAPDSRVKKPHRDRIDGKSTEVLPILKLRLACEYAAEAIRSGKDFSPIFAYLQNEYTLEDIPTDKQNIQSFFDSLLPSESIPGKYYEIWQRFEKPIDNFLNTLEEYFKLPGLARRVLCSMARVILEETEISQPIAVGNTYGIRVEVTEPIEDCLPPRLTERLHCKIELEGKKLGVIELPVFEGIISSSVLADAIAARWAMLPVDAISELTELSLVAKPLIHLPQPGSKPELIFYSPDLVLSPSKSQWRTTKGDLLDQKRAKPTNFYDRGYFEAVYSQQPDPWDYTSLYEQTLSLLPSGRIEQALELACAEGLFTIQLATCVDNLIAADISQVALERAAQRCGKLNNVSFKHLDFVRDPLPSDLDLIVCSEVLYFAGNREDLQAVAHKFIEFGSHTVSHRLLTSLSPTEIVREAARSRIILERELETPIRAFAYPHGDCDPVVKHLVGACGYVFGLSCQSGRSSFQDSLLELPRIEIEGTDSLQDIIVKFNS